MLYGEEHLNTVHVYMQDDVFLAKLDSGSFWVLNFSLSFLPKCSCVSLKVFSSVNWEWKNTAVQPDTLWLRISLCHVIRTERCICRCLWGGCSLFPFVFPRKFATDQPFVSACCRLASAHLDIPSCPSTMMLLQNHHFTLAVEISELMFCARDTE